MKYSVKVSDDYGTELYAFLIDADDEERAYEKAQQELLKEVNIDIINYIQPKGE